MKRRVFGLSALLLGACVIAFTATPASAHLRDRFGDVSVTVGWINEPAFAYEPNGVQVILERARPVAGPASESEGTPLAANQATLTVEIIFGEQDATVKTDPMPLTPFRFGDPGEWRSESIVPTRPGTYTFHITGKILGRDFDRFYTSGEAGAIEGTQYNDIQDVSAIAFPEEDPSTGELAAAVEQARTTLAAAANDASDDARNARLFGIIGIAVGALGLLVGLRRKKAAS